MKYKVKSNKGYFVDWVGKEPVFNENIIFGKRLSESGSENLIELLVGEYGLVCEKCAVCE